VRFIAGGKTRKEGSDGYIHAPTATPPLRGRGNGRRIRRENRRSPLQSEQPRYTDIGRERPVLAKLKRRSAGSLSSHSMTVPRAGAELQPHVIVSLVQREGLQVFTPSPLAIPCGSSSFRARQDGPAARPPSSRCAIHHPEGREAAPGEPADPGTQPAMIMCSMHTRVA
jgi:hypothetical protein